MELFSDKALSSSLPNAKIGRERSSGLGDVATSCSQRISKLGSGKSSFALQGAKALGRQKPTRCQSLREDEHCPHSAQIQDLGVLLSCCKTPAFMH